MVTGFMHIEYANCYTQPCDPGVLTPRNLGCCTIEVLSANKSSISNKLNQLTDLIIFDDIFTTHGDVKYIVWSNLCSCADWG